MAGTFLIIGLTLFLLGSLGLAREASVRGHSWVLLLLPFASARFVQNNWGDVWLPAMMRVLGFALALAAAGITIARDPLVLENPERMFGVTSKPEVAGSKRADMNSFVNSAEAIQIAIRNDDNEKLSGRLHGQPFLFDRVEVINGLLAARQGSGFLPDLELRILLQRDFSNLEQREKIYVQPGDPNPPAVHISWKDDQGTLQTEILRSGYRMELQLAPLTHHQLSGFLQIILPDSRQSFLSGEFVAYTNRLRYLNDRVDLTYDHEDTLKYVAEQYLHTQYPEGAIDRIIFSDTDMRLSRDEGSTTATVRLANGRIERREIPLERSDIGWAVLPSGVESSVIAEGGGTSSVVELSDTTSGRGQGKETPTETEMQTRKVAFEVLPEFLGLQVITWRKDDKRQEGILREVDEKRIVVEASLGSGTVRYQVKREDLARMEVPARHLTLHVKAPAGSDTAVPADSGETPAPSSGNRDAAEPTPVPEAASEETGSSGELPGSPGDMVGKRVTITGASGRSRTGILKSLVDGQVTLTVQMGSGSVDYYYKIGEIRSLEAAEAP